MRPALESTERRRAGVAEPPADVSYSVVIPTRNRAKCLDALLASLARQRPPNGGWEVLVVNNGSTDDTEDVVRRHQPGFPVALRVVNEGRTGLHAGRNRGARESRADYLCYLDDDVTVSDEWLCGWAEVIDRQADAAVGPILPAWEAQPPSWVLEMVATGKCGALTLLDLGQGCQRVDTSLVWGANFLVRRSLVEEYGGFPPDGVPEHLLKYRGDGESGFFLGFARAGKTAWYAPGASVRHHVPGSRLTVDYFRERAFRQGVSNSYRQIRDRFWKQARGGEKGPAPRAGRLGWLLWRARAGLAWRLHAVRRRMGATSQEAPAGSTTLHADAHADTELRPLLERAVRDGFRWHQAEVLRDYALFEWVLARDYWENAIPAATKGARV